MNADTGRLYVSAEEIQAAEGRKEPLIYGDRDTLEDLQPLLLNRAQRRLAARIAWRGSKRGK